MAGAAGYVTRPPGKAAAKGLPLVVLVHGGPYGVRDEWNYDPDTQVLASRGYAVLQVNFRGSGGRGYAFQQADHRQWGRLMQDDVTDATRWSHCRGRMPIQARVHHGRELWRLRRPGCRGEGPTSTAAPSARPACTT